ncbi:hypothetical protein UNH65_26915 [Chitinophaga sp. 180180018-2]|jgi:hypothetical protein|nr:hypothetical protein [Chitinophaga sp. 212800010-3]
MPANTQNLFLFWGAAGVSSFFVGKSYEKNGESIFFTATRK